MEPHRCRWASTPLGILYHDREWGVPVHDDRLLFEFLILEGAQAGLSWETILRKRERYREVFDQFDAERIAVYGESDLARLLAEPGIVRNRMKIRAAVQNASAVLEVRRECGTFDRWIWQFVGGRPKVNHRRSHSEIPSSSAESDAMSRELKKRGFAFVGTTICYAFMQAVGMVNDHEIACFRWKELQELA